jgi:nitrate/nitrite-specific signal transduction histidine kinase
MEEAPQTNLSLKSNETAQASLELLYHISRELVTVLDLRTVLERVVYLSMQTTGAISGSIIVMDDNGRNRVRIIARGEVTQKGLGLQAPPGGLIPIPARTSADAAAV